MSRTRSVPTDLLRKALALALAGAVFNPVEPAWAEQEVVVPPLVSGRRLEEPETIQPADVLARVELLRGHLEDIRAYMGRPPPPEPLLRVEGAQPREVFIQALNLFRRVQQLGFEQLRTPLVRLRPPDQQPGPAETLGVVNRALGRILELKLALGVDRAVAEVARPTATTATEVFNAVVEVGELVHALLDRKTTSSTVYSGIITALQLARSLHARKTRRFLPKPSPFEPNKTPREVYRVLHACLDKIRSLAEANDLEMLAFALKEEARTITPDDVLELLAVIVSELNFLHERLLKTPADAKFIEFQRKFPSHSYQKARDLEAILESLLKANRR